MSETPTNPDASHFTELTAEQVEAHRRSAYAYACPPAPELLSAEQEAARYQREASDMLFDVLTGERDAEQGVTDLLAHLLTEHKADNLALIAQIRQSEARAAEAEAQVAMLRVELAEQERKEAQGA